MTENGRVVRIACACGNGRSDATDSSEMPKGVPVELTAKLHTAGRYRCQVIQARPFLPSNAVPCLKSSSRELPHLS
jgi:hypothetical protein